MKNYFTKHLKWNFPKPIQEDGVIVAADASEEWLLPWWWGKYCRFNSYPVTFVDLGLTPKMQEWCETKGRRLPLRIPDFATPKEEIDPTLIPIWEDVIGPKVWDFRDAWYKKPFACLLTPYQRSIWIDLD